MNTHTSCRLFHLGVLLSILISKTEGHALGKDFNCWKEPADIVFVLDASTSIWSVNFQKELDFVKYIVDHLNIGLGPNQVRIGVETFSDSAYVNVYLSDSNDKTTLKKRIDVIPYATGSTDIGGALNLLLSEMFTVKRGSRPYAKRVAIILTDGTAQDRLAAQKAAKACRDANIHIIAIGIGLYIDPEELRKIASEPRFYYETADFDTLNLIREDVIRETCIKVTTPETQTTTPNPSTIRIQNMEACNEKIADIFFLLDSSTSITLNNYKKQINAVESIVSQFDISPLATRVGMAVYNHEYYPVLDFDTGADKKEALRVIRNASYKGGATNTGNALKHVRYGIFNESSRRSDAEHILIVYTDGHSANYEQTAAEARLLKQSGVKIFAIGIGQQVANTDLEEIASKPYSHFMQTFETFDALVRKSNLLTFKACTVNKCNAQSTQDECNVTRKTDVVFAVSNTHFGKWKTDRILKASAEVMSTVKSSRVFRFGSIYDNCLPKQDLEVGSIAEESQLVSFNYGSIGSLVKKLRTDSFHNASLNRRSVGLLFLDSTIDLRQGNIMTKAEKARLQNIDLYAVVIGEGVNKTHVENFVTSKEHIISIYSYDDLISYLPSQFTKRLCQKSNEKSTFRPPMIS